MLRARGRFVHHHTGFMGVIGLVLAVLLAGCETTSGQQDRPQAPLEGADTALSEPQTPPPFTPPAGQGRDDLVRVGLLLPYDSEEPAVRRAAEALRRAAELALFSGPDTGLMLLPKDTGGNGARAAAAAQAAIDDGADVIVGPLLAESVAAVADVAAAAEVPVFAFSNNRAVAGEGVYLISFQVEDDVAAIVDHAMVNGAGRMAAIGPDTEFARRGIAAFEREVFLRGGAVTGTRIHQGGAEFAGPAMRVLSKYEERAARLERTRARLQNQLEREDLDRRARRRLEDILEQLERRETLGGAPFDAILIMDMGSAAKSTAALLPFFEVPLDRVQVLGPGQWMRGDLSEEPALIGAAFPSPPPRTARRFEDRYRAAFGETPPRIAALAHDATLLVSLLVRENAGEPFTREAIEDPRGFQGATGVFRLRANGTTERALAIWEITREGPRPLAPAPDRFLDIQEDEVPGPS